jgi:arylsulfatase A
MTREKYDPKRKNFVPLMRGTEVIEFPADQTTLTQRYTKESIDFINQNKTQPFFLYLAHSMPHIPLYTSENFTGKSERGPYGDVIEEIDWSTGEILRCLKENGIDDNTLIIYSSDNGPWLAVKENGGSALPLKGGKFSTWEGGQRVPTIMRWPTKVPAGKVCNQLGSTIDLLPTIAKLVGSSLPDYKIDGIDIINLILNPENETTSRDFFYISPTHELAGIRSGKWKLHGNALYNLDEDLSETKNIAAQHPEIVQELKSKMDQFAKESDIPQGTQKNNGNRE